MKSAVLFSSSGSCWFSMHHSWYSKSNELESLNHHEVITTPKKFLSACDLHQIKSWWCGSTHSGNLRTPTRRVGVGNKSHLFLLQGSNHSQQSQSKSRLINHLSQSIEFSRRQSQTTESGPDLSSLKMFQRKYWNFCRAFLPPHRVSLQVCERVKYMYLTVNETYHIARFRNDNLTRLKFLTWIW